MKRIASNPALTVSFLFAMLIVFLIGLSACDRTVARTVVFIPDWTFESELRTAFTIEPNCKGRVTVSREDPKNPLTVDGDPEKPFFEFLTGFQNGSWDFDLFYRHERFSGKAHDDAELARKVCAIVLHQEKSK